MDEQDYDRAAALLIAAHDRHILERMTRALFLSKEHYAVSHFFQAVCAEKQKKLPLAYTEYRQAYSDAKMANRMLMAFLANLHKLNVLILIKEDLLPDGRNREAELNNTLQRLTLEFEVGFAELYYKIHANITKVAAWCLNTEAWSKQQLLDAKEFLTFERFFLLKYFAKGEGELLQIIGGFFQGLLSAVLEHREEAVLATFKTASEKLQQIAKDLIRFKKSFAQPSPWTCNQRQMHSDMDNTLAFMQEFIIDFHAHCAVRKTNFKRIYEEVAARLGLDSATADLRLEQIRHEYDTLIALSKNFKQRFFSLEQWLDALSAPDNSVTAIISDTTGDTMLHLLVKIRLSSDALLPKVRKLIAPLQRFSHTMNHANETPLSLLEADDPYSLKNDFKSYVLFQEAIKYERGEEGSRDYVKAAEHYQQAIDAGYLVAQQHLDNLLSLPDITAEALYLIGKMYYKGSAIGQIDYEQAKKCFESASHKGSAVSDYNLGVMYRKGQGSPQCLLKASQYYIRAAEQGYKPMDIQVYHETLLNEPQFPQQRKKFQAKAFEKALITGCFLSSGDYPNTRDKQKNTLLHRSRQKKYYKHCARLILFGAKKDLANDLGRYPFHNLSIQEQRKINKLQFMLLDLRKEMRLPQEDVLVRRVRVKGAIADEIGLKAMFAELDTFPELQPLLALAKLAALGLHDLAERRQFINQNADVDYDSDEDDTEVIRNEQKLSFLYDAANNTVENLFHYGVNGQQGCNAYGMYTNQNEIYMGGQRGASALRGTTIHELTHFLAKEVFKNECKPYPNGDTRMEEAFQKIISEIDKRHNTLTANELTQIRQVFTCYEDKQWPCELIVRVPQIIAEHGNAGREKLEQCVHELLFFYNHYFLPCIVAHTDKLSLRALSGWQESLFQRSESEVFRFEEEKNNCIL